MNMLYKKHLYLNRNIEYLISNEIVEYDIKSAGFNIVKKFKLLEEYRIRHLEKLSRERRNVLIGLYSRTDKVLAKAIKTRTIEVRKWFMEQNGLEEEDILSIKNDAIYTLRRCNITKLDNIEFVEKNIYSSYYYLNGYEFYYNKDVVHIKGVHDSKLEFHKDYMLFFLKEFFRMNEMSTKKKVIGLLKDFSTFYKNRQLPIDYYRELNKQSLYKLKVTFLDERIGIRDVGDIDSIDIDYNYMHYVVPLINIIL